jgi:LDH2 family malate/lactate/ureidoglycolate dehydrogenase
MTGEVPIDVDRAIRVSTRALESAGATWSDAHTQAGHLVEAELRGHRSHGLRRLPVLVQRLRSGVIRSGIEPRIERTGLARVDVDGRDGFGPVVANAAIDELIRLGSGTGVMLASLRHVNHLGMLSPYLERLASANRASIILTTSEALVHPWGSATPLVGTNPIGIGVPTDSEPLIVDMSTAATSIGRIHAHAARGESIPTGWAVDADGEPTRDASAVHALSPFGGAKGYALGVALEALVGAVTSTSFGTDVQGTLDAAAASTKGDVIIAIEAGSSLSTMQALGRYLASVRASGSDSGSVHVPGDRARKVRLERLREGLRIDRTTWDQVEVLGRGGR